MKVKEVYTNYEQARDKIEFGVFVSRTYVGIFSKLVRLITSIVRLKKARFSHAGFILRERLNGIDEERVVVYEADFGSKMLRKIPASVRFNKNLEYRIYDLRLPIAQVRSITSSLYFMWGVPYDTRGAVLAPFVDTKTMSMVFCSEVLRSLLNLPTGNLPEDIADYLDSKIVLST